MMCEGAPEGFQELCNGATCARRMRPGSTYVLGQIGIVIMLPEHHCRIFRKWTAVRRIQKIRAARGIPYDADSIKTACDFEPL